MMQTHENLVNLATGENVDPVLAITDDIFHDSLPEEYKYLNPHVKVRESLICLSHSHVTAMCPPCSASVYVCF
jgi:hypothetical protein